jgi:hypothetical protein
MKMSEIDDMARLNALLEDAAKNRGVPQELTRRVLADAEALQPRNAPPDRPRRRRSIWAVLSSWPAMGGLVAATCAGFWVGISPPVFLPDAGALVLGASEDVSYEVLSDGAGFGWALEEG